jgi:cytochrome c oxidase subunit 2
MIPGRRNRLALHPLKPGMYRGACAEYCGDSHALMNFYVVVHGKEEFAQWLAREAQPARPPATPLAARGQEAFLANGCGACHTVRGTPATGVVGPDLTHIGGRLSLAAGILPNEPEDFVRWIAHVREIKPGARMPPFGMLPQDDLRAIAEYLNGLQ